MMYIPEFWCGVIITILAELAATFLIVAWSMISKGDKNESDDNDKMYK